ncbi:MAG TPA: ABC transporter permease, partial [Clostridia bacterium]|nr:ABC transporter permease [Clostridia bacterium]
ANICILSAMVLVTVSSTVCLYVGMHDALNNRFPTDIEIITHNADKEQSVSISNAVNKIVSESGYEISKYSEFRYLSHSMLYEEEKDTFSICFDINKNSDNMYYVYFFPVEDYNKKTGTDILLEDKEVLIYNRNNVDFTGNLNIQSIEFIVKGNVKDPGFPMSVDGFNKVYLFFKDEQVIIDINKQFEEYFGAYSSLTHTIAFDVMGDKAEQLKLTDRIKVTFERLEENISINTISKAEEEYVFYAIYGGLFFLGLFLGVLFMMATVLIIYYKQISEGYEDKQRFHIMQQVGMTKAEVRQSIRSQVLTVFFLPLIMAIIHIVFAFRMITKILGVLYLTNVPLFINCTVITVAAFTLFYMAAYSLTAHSYYKIVE